MNLDILGNEDFMPDYRNIRIAYNVPSFLRQLISNVLEFFGQRRTAMYTKTVGEGNVKAYNHIIFQKLKMVKEFEDIYEKYNLD